MNNKIYWRKKDIIIITLSIVILFSILLAGIYFLKKFTDLEPAILALIIDSGFFLSIICTYFIYSKKIGINYSDLGFKDIKKRWLFLSILAGLFVVFIGGGLSTLLSGVLSLDVTSSLIEKDILSGKLWLDLLNFKLLVGILVPISEEIYFRGILFRYFRGKFSFLYAGILSTLIFSVFHFNLVLIPFTFVLGFISAYLFEKTQSIVPSFIVHITANTMAVNLLMMGVYFI